MSLHLTLPQGHGQRLLLREKKGQRLDMITQLWDIRLVISFDVIWMGTFRTSCSCSVEWKTETISLESCGRLICRQGDGIWSRRNPLRIIWQWDKHSATFNHYLCFRHHHWPRRVIRLTWSARRCLSSSGTIRELGSSTKYKYTTLVWDT